MTDAAYPLYPICAFFGFILVVVPMPWHLRQWNTSTVWFMTWTSLACLNQFVNSVIWHGNVINRTPWWCDVSSRIILGAAVGIPASCMSINRRLFIFTHLKIVSVSSKMKIREALIDTIICFFFPLSCIGLAYIVQGHRYNIFEDIGCYPAIYNTLLAYFLVFAPPLVTAIVSIFFGVLTLVSFARRSSEIKQIMSSSSRMTLTRYLRLMAMTMTEMCFNAPLTCLTIALNARVPVHPWVSWDDTHFNFGRVNLYPSVFWRDGSWAEAQVELSRWIAPFCAFVFFCLFWLLRGYAQVIQACVRISWSVYQRFEGDISAISISYEVYDVTPIHRATFRGSPSRLVLD